MNREKKKEEVASRNKLWKTHLRSQGVEFDDDLNPRHSLYYKAQLPFLEDEWRAFSLVLCRPLPATFRFSDRLDGSLLLHCRQQLHQLCSALRNRYVEFDGQIIDNKDDFISAVTGFSDVFQAKVDNRFISHCTALSEIHSFLTHGTSAGWFVRQEIASMLPVLLLNPAAEHWVLDVCAAPGSKTEQILATMTSSQRCQSSPSTPPFGFLLANDADPKRLHTLRHRFFQYPSAHFAVSCLDGSTLSTAFPPEVRFDRIICDVPCSGDGTFRKCPHLYRLFRPRHGLELHTIQLRILLEALSILKVGGRLVYSTCSLNPIEDEAVVSAALRHYTQSVRLLTASELALDTRLPGFRLRPGVTTWRSDTEVFLLGEESEAEREKTRKRLSPLLSNPSLHIAAPTEPFILTLLPNCFRLLPQDQDTGGFFLAVFEKTSEVGAVCRQSAESAHQPSADTAQTSGAEVAESTMKELGYNPKGQTRVAMELSKEMWSFPSSSSSLVLQEVSPNTVVQFHISPHLSTGKQTSSTETWSFAMKVASAMADLRLVLIPAQQSDDRSRSSSQYWLCMIGHSLLEFLRQVLHTVPASTVRDRLASFGIVLGTTTASESSSISCAVQSTAEFIALGCALWNKVLQPELTTTQQSNFIAHGASTRSFLSSSIKAREQQRLLTSETKTTVPSATGKQADPASSTSSDEDHTLIETPVPVSLYLHQQRDGDHCHWKVASIGIGETIVHSASIDEAPTLYVPESVWSASSSRSLTSSGPTSAASAGGRKHLHLAQQLQFQSSSFSSSKQTKKDSMAALLSLQITLPTTPSIKSESVVAQKSELSGAQSAPSSANAGTKKRKSRAEQRALKRKKVSDGDAPGEGKAEVDMNDEDDEVENEAEIRSAVPSSASVASKQSPSTTLPLIINLESLRKVDESTPSGDGNQVLIAECTGLVLKTLDALHMWRDLLK